MPESFAPGSFELSVSSDEQAARENSSAPTDVTTPMNRKRKTDAVEDASGKRSKDCSGRTPLRVVPDSEANRQPAIQVSNTKSVKHGPAAAEKENECDDLLHPCSGTGSRSESAVEHDSCNQIDLANVHSSSIQDSNPTTDSSSLLLSRDTLDRQGLEDGDAYHTDDEAAQTFHFPDNGASLNFSTGSVAEDLAWAEVSRPAGWHLPCEYPEAVPHTSLGLWGTMPVQSPIHCPSPIIEQSGDQKVLVLDMDETLIHASAHELPEVDFKVTDPFGMCASKISVKKRPHVEYFLQEVAKLYKVIIFTAGTKEYATQVLDQLDPNGTLFAHRLFRENCLLVGHLMVKDLRLVSNDLSQVIIVDNTPSAYLLQRENGIHIPSYFGVDPEDQELLHLLPFLQGLAGVNDVRPHIVHYATMPRAPFVCCESSEAAGDDQDTAASGLETLADGHLGTCTENTPSGHDQGTCTENTPSGHNQGTCTENTPSDHDQGSCTEITPSDHDQGTCTDNTPSE